MVLNKLTDKSYARKDTTILGSSLFSYDKDTKKFVGEISNLQHPIGQLTKQLYNDACDIGFWVKSDKTEKIMSFYYRNEIKENDEIIGWEFGGDNQISLVIFND